MHRSDVVIFRMQPCILYKCGMKHCILIPAMPPCMHLTMRFIWATLNRSP